MKLWVVYVGLAGLVTAVFGVFVGRYFEAAVAGALGLGALIYAKSLQR
jgi:hypothetical protein